MSETQICYHTMVILLKNLEHLNQTTDNYRLSVAVSYWIQDAKRIIAAMEQDGWNPHSV